jgi:hypothetical protein
VCSDAAVEAGECMPAADARAPLTSGGGVGASHPQAAAVEAGEGVCTAGSRASGSIGGGGDTAMCVEAAVKAGECAAADTLDSVSPGGGDAASHLETAVGEAREGPRVASS